MVHGGGAWSELGGVSRAQKLQIGCGDVDLSIGKRKRVAGKFSGGRRRFLLVFRRVGWPVIQERERELLRCECVCFYIKKERET